MSVLCRQSFSIRRTLLTWGLILLGVLLFFGNERQASAAERTITVYLDTVEVNLPVKPVIQDGTTLVQMRPIFEKLQMKVTYDDKTKEIVAEKPGYSLNLTLNSTAAYVNGKQEKLLQPPKVVNGNTLIPIRFVSEATGSLVHWNGPGREITIMSPEFVQSSGVTMAEMRVLLNDAQIEIDRKYEEMKREEKRKEEERKRQEQEKNKPVKKVDLNKLQGMYFGFESDLAGYECGGLCTRFYTFLPGKKVVVGEPAAGGPETIDCKKDKCQSYSIKNGKIVLSGGKSLSIGHSKSGKLMINNVIMSPAKSAKKDLKLNGSYVTTGYTGLVGITPASIAWSKYMTFKSDGSFTSDHFWNKAASGNQEQKGTYKISGNTITFHYSDGRKVSKVFIQDDDDSLQIGEYNFDPTK